MAELEIHHEIEHEHDSFGKTIGIVAAVIGVILAVDTIQSHRAHTDAVIARTEANDQWAYYQAEGVKGVQYKIAADMAKASAATEGFSEKYAKQVEHYADKSKEIQQEARAKEAETSRHEARALRFDIGEGLLELGLVLCSLYFISKNKMFPAVGIISAIAGAIFGTLGFFVP